MATIDDFGSSGDPLDGPKFGGPDGWAAAVRDSVRALEAKPLMMLTKGNVGTGDADIALTGDPVNGYRLDMTLPAVGDESIGVDALIPGTLGYFDVRSYGAVGDGVTDDTAAVRRALAAVSSSGRQGGTVLFPQGTFRITGTLTIESENVNIRGTGHRNVQTPLPYDGDTLRLIPNPTAPSTIFNDHAGPLFKLSHSHPINGFTVADITLVGLIAQRQTAGHAAFDFDLAGNGAFARDFTVTRTTVTHFSTAFLARASTAEGIGSDHALAMLRISDCNLMHNRWITQCLNAITWNQFVFENNDAGQNGYQPGEGGVQVAGHNITIVNNIMEGERDPVIVTGYAGRSVVIRGNYFEANVGRACVQVSDTRCPVDIGPNYFGNVDTTHKVLLMDGVYGRCVDQAFPANVAKLTPRPNFWTTSTDGSDEYRLTNAQLADRPYVYVDCPRANDLVTPQGLLHVSVAYNGTLPTAPFIPGSNGGDTGVRHVPVRREALSGSGLLAADRTIAGVAGQVLVATWAMRSVDGTRLGPYLALRPNDAATELIEFPASGIGFAFRSDEWVTITAAMLLTVNCSTAMTYCYPYGQSVGSGKEIEYLAPTVYTVADISSVKPWLPMYGTSYQAPVAGTWSVGDEIINQTPTSGGAYKWVCTAAGTPGTWKAVVLT